MTQGNTSNKYEEIRGFVLEYKLAVMKISGPRAAARTG